MGELGRQPFRTGSGHVLEKPTLECEVEYGWPRGGLCGVGGACFVLLCSGYGRGPPTWRYLAVSLGSATGQPGRGVVAFPRVHWALRGTTSLAPAHPCWPPARISVVLWNVRYRGTSSDQTDTDWQSVQTQKNPFSEK